MLGTHLLNVDRVLVVPHTRCAVASNSAAQLRSRVGDSAGKDASWMSFHVIEDQERALREDVAKVRSHPLIAKGTVVGGFLYDVDTGPAPADRLKEAPDTVGARCRAPAPTVCRMPFDHLVLTRFSAVRRGQVEPMPAEWLTYRLGFFYDACHPSLTRQVGAAPFRWLVFLDDRCPDDFREQMRSWPTAPSSRCGGTRTSTPSAAPGHRAVCRNAGCVAPHHDARGQ